MLSFVHCKVDIVIIIIWPEYKWAKTTVTKGCLINFYDIEHEK